MVDCDLAIRELGHGLTWQKQRNEGYPKWPGISQRPFGKIA
jgi:hypothetical protein